MTATCASCWKQYDDTYRLTICPHERFEMRTVVIGPEGIRGVATTVEALRRLMR